MSRTTVRFWALGGVWALMAAFLSCVSRTGPGQRFSESRALMPPVASVAVADPDRFSFAAIGDLHIGGGGTGRLREVIQQTSALGGEFAVLLGDIVDKGDEGDFIAVNNEATGLAFQNRLLRVIGNHDVFYDGWTHWKRHFGPSHYRVTAGNSRFFVLDTADGTIGEDQMEWLESQLAEPWTGHTFLCQHYPPIGPNYLRLAVQDEATHLMRLARTHRVTAVLAGHYHSYLNREVAGTDYVIAGGGGGRRMDPIRDHFFVLVKVDGSNVSYELRTLD